MRRWCRKALTSLACVAAASFPLSAFAERGTGRAAHADGPPLARTGGFGEPTCQECHHGNALNQAPGDVTIAGLPDSYQPNRSYELTAVLTRPEMRVAGFQLSVRTHDRSALQAGDLAPADDRTALATDARTVTSAAPRTTHHALAVQYLQHSRRGAGLTASDTAQWRFTWRAPEAFGPVVFHIAANAANADNSPLDDFIYTRVMVLQPLP